MSLAVTETREAALPAAAARHAHPQHGHHHAPAHPHLPHGAALELEPRGAAAAAGQRRYAAAARGPRAGAGARAARQLAARLRPVEAPARLGDAVGVAPPPPGGPSLAALGGGVLAAASGAARAVYSLTQPRGDTSNDDGRAQRAVNVLTSLPLAAIGLHAHGRRRTPEGRAHAASLVAVGAAAVAYHLSWGRPRRLARKLDYWTICGSSTLLLHALHPRRGRLAGAALAASAAATPFRPFWVSTGHAVAAQLEYARQAAAHPGVRPGFAVHMATAVAALASFAVEDAAIAAGFEHAHSAWHLVAAAGVASLSPLVEHVEGLSLQAAAAALAPPPPAGGGGGKPLPRGLARGRVHLRGDSPSSLEGRSPRPPPPPARLALG